MVPNMITVYSDNGRTFNVKLVRAGERYGLRDCLTHDTPDPLVEFYDTKYAGDPAFGPHGQFVSRYYASTLLTSENLTRGGGLDLVGYAPEWKIDGVGMAHVLRWLRAVGP